jgi:hypothetical protein
MAVRIRPPSPAMQPRSCSFQDHRAAMSARRRSSAAGLMPQARPDMLLPPVVFAHRTHQDGLVAAADTAASSARS